MILPNQPTDDGGEAELSEADLSTLFHHDPMADAGDKASGDEGAEAAEGEEPEVATAPEGATPGEAPGAVTPPPNGQTSPVDMSGLPQQIADAVRNAVKPAPAAESTDDTPAYMYQIPPQLQQAMEAEDPATRAKGYAHFGAGLAKAVHTTVLTQVKAMLEKAQTEIPARLRAEQDQTRRNDEVGNDFRTAHPDLANPRLGVLVYQEAQALAREQPALLGGAWNAKFRDALAARLRTTLGLTAPAKTKPKAPPKMLNGGSRPATEQLTGQAKELADMFNSPFQAG